MTDSVTPDALVESLRYHITCPDDGECRQCALTRAAAARIEALTYDLAAARIAYNACRAERDEALRDEEAWLRSMVEPTIHSDAEFARWAIQRCYDRLALLLARQEAEG